MKNDNMSMQRAKIFDNISWVVLTYLLLLSCYILVTSNRIVSDLSSHMRTYMEAPGKGIHNFLNLKWC